MLAGFEDCGKDGGTEATASSSGECDFDHGVDGKQKGRLGNVYACREALPVHLISRALEASRRRGCRFVIPNQSAVSIAPNARRAEASAEAMIVFDRRQMTNVRRNDQDTDINYPTLNGAKRVGLGAETVVFMELTSHPVYIENQPIQTDD